MTLITSGFDAEASFIKLIQAQALLIQADLITASLLPTGGLLKVYTQAKPEAFPAIRTWFHAGAGQARGGLLVSRCQVDIYVCSPDPETRDGRLLKLTRDTLTFNLGIRQRGEWTAYIDVKGHFANPGSPQLTQHARLELADPAGGWTAIPQPDTKISCVSRDFKIFYR